MWTKNKPPIYAADAIEAYKKDKFRLNLEETKETMLLNAVDIYIYYFPRYIGTNVNLAVGCIFMLGKIRYQRP